ncbi:MAG TPA: hypothetical protein VLB73_00285 [Patescibacteria group bacterium]|nr:hypothetical protein [Patescibacteria group bacterium]
MIEKQFFRNMLVMSLFGGQQDPNAKRRAQRRAGVKAALEAERSRVRAADELATQHADEAQRNLWAGLMLEGVRAGIPVGRQQQEEITAAERRGAEGTLGAMERMRVGSNGNGQNGQNGHHER